MNLHEELGRVERNNQVAPEAAAASSEVVIASDQSGQAVQGLCTSKRQELELSRYGYPIGVDRVRQVACPYV